MRLFEALFDVLCVCVCVFKKLRKEIIMPE